MQLFLNCTEVIELDLSNNMLTKLPLEISFLTCLTKLDIRNNAFSNVNKYIYNNYYFIVWRYCKNSNNYKIFNWTGYRFNRFKWGYASLK